MVHFLQPLLEANYKNIILFEHNCKKIKNFETGKKKDQDYLGLFFYLSQTGKKKDLSKKKTKNLKLRSWYLSWYFFFKDHVFLSFCFRILFVSAFFLSPHSFCLRILLLGVWIKKKNVFFFFNNKNHVTIFLEKKMSDR